MYNRPQRTRTPPPGRRPGLRQPAAPKRRFFSGWPGRTLIGLTGFALGIVSGYVTDVVKLKFPVAEIADLGADYVSTTVILERNQGTQGELWVYPFAVSTRPDVEELVVNPFENLTAFHEDLRDSGAIDANVTLAKLIVSGSRNNPVRIVDIRAVAVSKTEPLAGGTVLLPGPQGASDSAQIAFDLDSADMAGVTPKESLEYGPYFDDYFAGAPAFSDYTVVLERGEQQVFQITARTFRHHVRWNIELDIFANDRTTTVTANLNGEPLETTALAVPPGGEPTTPDETKYREIYDFFASPNVDRFARTK